MKKILVLALLLVAAPAAAQEAEAQPATQVVRGVVVDGVSQKPVPGASVYLVETGEVAVADDQGRVELPAVPGGAWHLAVVDPSYRRADQKIVVASAGPPPAPVTIQLTPLSLRGEEIVVEAERERAAAGETTLKREELVKMPGARGDVLTVVKSLPGVANVQTFGATAGLVIRGSAPADSRIFVDGFEIPILYHFGGFQSVIPSEMIDDIVYTPGAFGIELGKASGGVVEVRTRKGDRDYAGFGEVSFVNAGAFAKGPLGKSATFSVAARRSLIDTLIPLVISEDTLSFTTLPTYYDFQTRLDWQPADHWNLSLFVFGDDDRLELVVSEQNERDPLATGTFKNRSGFVRGIAAATYDRPGRYNRLSASVGTDLDSFEVGSDRYLRVERDTVNVRDEAKIRLAEPLSLLAGGEVEFLDVSGRIKLPRPPREGQPSDPSFTYDPVIMTDIAANAYNLATWAGVEVIPAPWFKTTAGARLDAFTRNDVVLVQPRAQMRVGVAPRTAILAAGGLYSRPPDSNDENLQTDLEPEHAYQTSLGVEQKLARGVTLQTTGFYIVRDNMIVFSEGTDRTSAAMNDGSGTYTNEGEGLSYGGEALLQVRRDDFFGWIAYTLSRSERVDHPGEEARLFDYDQTHNLILVASWKFGKQKQWQLGGRFQYTTGAPYTPVTGAAFNSDNNTYTPMYGATNSERNPAQHQLDLRLDRTFAFKSWKLATYVDVSNVYMHAAVVDYDYSYDYREREEITGLPILPSLGVRGEF